MGMTMKAMHIGLAAAITALSLAGCASMGSDSAMRADTASVLGVEPADLTILSKKYEANTVGAGYALTTYTVALKSGLTYACTLDDVQQPLASTHYSPVCRKNR
jgi:hypothetical protein